MRYLNIGRLNERRLPIDVYLDIRSSTSISGSDQFQRMEHHKLLKVKLKKNIENRSGIFLLFAALFFSFANGFALLGDYAVNEEDYRKYFIFGAIVLF